MGKPGGNSYDTPFRTGQIATGFFVGMLAGLAHFTMLRWNVRLLTKGAAAKATALRQQFAVQQPVAEMTSPSATGSAMSTHASRPCIRSRPWSARRAASLPRTRGKHVADLMASELALRWSARRSARG